MEKNNTSREEVIEKAKELAKTSGKSQKFEFYHPEDSDRVGYARSCAGSAWPCGCVSFDTILSDGSLGWGSWTEQCTECAWDS